MIDFRNAPIRRKFTASLLLTSLVVMLLMGGAFFAHDFIALGRNTLRQVRTLGELVARNSTDALAFSDQDAARELLAALADEPHIVEACFYDRSGRLFARYPAILAGGAFPASALPDGYRIGTTTVEGVQPVVQKGVRVGTLYLQFDRGAILREWFRDSAGIAVLVMAGVFLAAYAIARVLERRISRPILVLAETAHAIAERQDYSVRAAKGGNDEIGLFTDAFNLMLAQIQKLNQTLEQRVLERTAQLQAANLELEAFSYSVSHDLRAPLRHVDGFAGLLRKHAAATLDEKGQRYLVTISDAAKRMGRLIDDLLAFSRISRSPLGLAEIDHDALVAAVIREGSFESAERPIEWSIPPLPRVHADPAMLRQVWANLLANAVKYSGKNPQPRIAIASDQADGEHVFSVSDNGVGFDMAYAHKLFGVFQRLHGPTEFEGTGIGLANVRRIVARHAGRTWAEGRLGEGATFHFSLPIQPAPPS